MVTVANLDQALNLILLTNLCVFHLQILVASSLAIYWLLFPGTSRVLPKSRYRVCFTCKLFMEQISVCVKFAVITTYITGFLK